MFLIDRVVIYNLRANFIIFSEKTANNKVHFESKFAEPHINKNHSAHPEKLVWVSKAF